MPCGTRLSCHILAAVPGPWLFPCLHPLGFTQTEEPKLPPAPRRVPRICHDGCRAPRQPRRGRAGSHPPPRTQCPAGVNLVPELTGSMSGLFPCGREMGSVPRWEADAFQGSTACVGSSSPSRTGRVTHRTWFPGAGSYRTSSGTRVPSKRPLPRARRAGTATDARDGHRCQGWPPMPGMACPWQGWSPGAPAPAQEPSRMTAPHIHPLPSAARAPAPSNAHPACHIFS